MRFSLRWLNLFADLLRLPVLSLRSKTPLAAENLFLRKQLAFCQERKIRPRRSSTSNPLEAGVARPPVQLAKRIDHRNTQNLHRLASQRVPALLALEMPIRPTTDSAGPPTV